MIFAKFRLACTNSCHITQTRKYVFFYKIIMTDDIKEIFMFYVSFSVNSSTISIIYFKIIKVYTIKNKFK